MRRRVSTTFAKAQRVKKKEGEQGRLREKGRMIDAR